MHFVPTYSLWLNQVKRFFAIITVKAIRREYFKSVKALVKKIENIVEHFNQKSKPFVWTAKADPILSKLQRLC